MKTEIKKLITEALVKEGVEPCLLFVVEHPADLSKGDYSTNVALAYSKSLNKNPLELAVTISDSIKQHLPNFVDKVEVAGAGFINFYLSETFFTESLSQIIQSGKSYGRGSLLNDQKIAIEYTDPNPFKQFHIGHLMTNIIGESYARLAEYNGAHVKRFCYQGDVGRHVALTLWGLRFMDKTLPEDDAPLYQKTKYLGEAYVFASKKIKENPEFESEVQEINKKIYDRSDSEVNDIYDKGREWSLEHFEEIYATLGTSFDHYFFESQTAPVGLELVKKNTPEVFKESEGAVIFPGEDFGLHTRVFITKERLPTYEAKDLGLSKIKYDEFAYDKGVVMTANEQDDYFKVVLKAISFIFPEIAEKSSHISHGMLRFADGKMSSRTGNVITGESLLNDMIEASYEKVKDRPLEEKEKNEIAKQVAVGALKYWILRQSVGKDIIFDKEKALSFEGDSGPYLQYAHTRAMSVLRKAKEEGIDVTITPALDKEGAGGVLLKALYRFPEIIEESYVLTAPHQVVTYLTDLASTFNSYYANTVILNKEDSTSASRVALVSAFAIVMRNGLEVLGIPVPLKM